MPNLRNVSFLTIIGLVFISLVSCEGMPGGDARKNPPDPKERVKKNLEEGRGFRLNDAIQGKGGKGGDFLFASANELWRASLDTIDFMPLSSVNYSGGIIITDWYSDGNNIDESVKISIRFLTGRMSLKQKKILKDFFLKNIGISYTFKLFIMAENIVKQESAMV